jgi:hypothetical protein
MLSAYFCGGCSAYVELEAISQMTLSDVEALLQDGLQTEYSVLSVIEPV